MLKLRTLLLCALLALAPVVTACGGGGSGGGGSGGNHGITLSYDSPVKLEVGVGANLWPRVTGIGKPRYTVAPALPAGLMLDPDTGQISGTPTAATAGATYTVTVARTGGAVAFPLVIEVGAAVSGKRVTPVSLAVVELSNPMPASNSPMTVTVRHEAASRIELTAAGTGCGGLTSQSVNATTLTQTDTVATTGSCRLTAKVTTSAGVETHDAAFSIVPNRLPDYVAGVTFRNGGYFPSGDINEFPVSATLRISQATAPQAFINGGSGAIFVRPNVAPSRIRRAVVSLSGFPGYFIAPVVVDGDRVRIDLSLAPDFFSRLQQAQAPALRSARRSGYNNLPAAPAVSYGPRGSGGASLRRASRSSQPSKSVATVLRASAQQTTGSTLVAYVQVIDDTGLISPAAAVNLEGQEVETGELQISVRWSAPVDVDLHVTTPAGELIYYGDLSDSTGGRLDLDSNPGCDIDNINNENIAWKSPARPREGDYTIFVHYYEACDIPGPIPFTVVVNDCGKTTTLSGTLLGDGSGVTVATLTHKPCNGLTAEGKAVYEDRVPARSGLSSTVDEQPIRFAKVEVRDKADGKVLGTGSTDGVGLYKVNFDMAEPGEYSVFVLTENPDDVLPQKVTDASGTVHEVESEVVDAADTPNATGVDLKATQGNGKAMPFNIYDVGITNLNHQVAWMPGELPGLTWIWQSGSSGCPGGSSCYTNGVDTINVLSANGDEDGYDDGVLSHEFGHYVLHHLSRENSRGGVHAVEFRVAPVLAWAEGAANFWAGRVLNSSSFYDVSSGQTGEVDLEWTVPLVPPGTSDGTMTGDLSENWVGATLWDLADAGQDSRGAYTDTVTLPDGVYVALISMRLDPKDRGAAGADLVDFADVWLCKAYGSWSLTGDTGFRDVLLGLNTFPYDPAGKPPC